MRAILLLLFLSIGINANSQSRKIPIDTTIVTNHNTTVKGQSFSYTATTGTQPVWDEMGNPTATLFYTYYTRDKVKDRASRPIIFSLMEAQDQHLYGCT